MPIDRSILNLKGVRLFCKLLKLPVHKVNNCDPDQIPRSASDLDLEQSDSFLSWAWLAEPQRIK